jgi:hypothetical protein
MQREGRICTTVQTQRGQSMQGPRAAKMQHPERTRAGAYHLRSLQQQGCRTSRSEYPHGRDTRRQYQQKDGSNNAGRTGAPGRPVPAMPIARPGLKGPSLRKRQDLLVAGPGMTDLHCRNAGMTTGKPSTHLAVSFPGHAATRSPGRRTQAVKRCPARKPGYNLPA